MNGNPWTLTSGLDLSQLANGTITLLNADGSEFTFTLNPGTGNYVSENGSEAYETLVANSNNTYTVTQSDQVQQNFNASGQLTSSVDPNGNTITYTYTNGLLSQQQDNDGNSINYNYINGYLSTLTDQNNRVLASYVYANGQLTSSTDADGQTTSYQYQNGELSSISLPTQPDTTDLFNSNTQYFVDYRQSLGITDAGGALTAADKATILASIVTPPSVYQFQYTTINGTPMLTSMLDPDTNLTQFNYQFNVGSGAYTGGTTQVISTTGTTTYTYNQNGQITNIAAADGQNTQYGYQNGRLASIQDAAGTTTNTYDPNTGNLLQEVDPNGGITTSTYTSTNQVKTIIDAVGNALVSSDDPIYAQMRFELGYIDSSNPGAGMTAAEVQSNPAVRNALLALYTTTYSYDNNDNLTDVVDGQGSDTHYTYYQDGNIQSKTVYTQANSQTTPTPPLVTNYTYFSNGLLKNISGAEGNEQYTYNANGNMLTATDAQNNVINYTYDADNRLRTETNALGQVTTHVYDARGNQISVTNSLGQTTYTVYDADGNALHSTAYATLTGNGSAPSGFVIPPGSPQDEQGWRFYNANGQLNAAVDAQGGATSYVYDAAGKLISQTIYATPVALPNAGQVQFVPPQESATAGQTTLYYYNAAGDLADEVDAEGKVTSYLYAAAHNLVSTTQYATAIAIPAEGEMPGTSLTLPLGTAQDETTNYYYDANDQRIAEVNAQGDVTTFAYDPEGRRISTTTYANRLLPPVAGQLPGLFAPPATSANDQTAWSIYNVAGQLLYMVDPAGSASGYTYDASGNVVSTTDYATPVTAPASGSLPPAGFQPAVTTTATLASHGEVDETSYAVYNNLNQLTYTINAKGGVTGHVYDAEGREVSTTVYAAAVAMSGYSTSTPPAESFTPQTTTGADSTSNTYYNSDGEVAYTVDPEGRVKGFTYDAFGNVISTTDYGTTVAQPQAGIAPVGTAPAGLTSSGSDETSRAVYNPLNQLAYTINAKGGVTGYVYDTQGQEVAATAYLTTYTVGNSAGTAATLANLNAFASTAAGNTGNTIYGQDGEVLYTIDAAGFVTGYTYDAFGNVVSTTQYATTAAIPNAAQPLTLATLNLKPTTVDETSYAVYNNLNQLTYTINAKGGVTGHVYDAEGREVSTTVYATAVAMSGYSTSTPPAESFTPQTTTGADSTSNTYYNSDGEVAYTVDPEGRVKGFTYDAFGNVISTTDYGTTVAQPQAGIPPVGTAPAGLTSSGSDETSRAVYNPLNQLAYTINARGGVTGYVYDTQGQEVAATAYLTTYAVGTSAGTAAGTN